MEYTDENVKLSHPQFGNCYVKRIDTVSYSIPMAVVYSDVAGDVICRPLLEFNLLDNEIYKTNSLCYRYLTIK